MIAYNQGRPLGASFDYGQSHSLPYLHHHHAAPAAASFEQQSDLQGDTMYRARYGHSNSRAAAAATTTIQQHSAYYGRPMTALQYQQRQLYQQQPYHSQPHQHAYPAYGYHHQQQQYQRPNDSGIAQSVHGSNIKLTDERAHLDRLFSALSAAHPVPPGFLAGGGASQVGSNGYPADPRSVATEHQQQWPAPDFAHAQTHNHAQLVGYGQDAQLSLPPPVPVPHQGAGLQPALDVDYGQSRRSSRGFMQAQQYQQPQAYFDGSTGIGHQAHPELAIEAPIVLPPLRHQIPSEMSQDAFYHQHLPTHMVDAHGHAQGQNTATSAQAWSNYSQPDAMTAAGNNTFAPMQAETVMPQREVTLDDEPQLIAPDASAIPPPPSIEKSAYPLAALATDLVWDAFLSAASHNSGMGSSPSMPSSGAASPVYQTNFRDSDMQQSVASSPLSGFGSSSHLTSRSSAHPPRPFAAAGATRTRQVRSISPQVRRTDRQGSSEASEHATPANTGNVYGAIGGERKPRPSNLATSVSPGSGSDSSSPASTAPGTPASDPSISYPVKTGSENSLGNRMHTRFSGTSIGTPFWGEDSYTEQHGQSKDMMYSLSGPSTMRTGVSQNNYARFMQDLSPPAALFEQIQKLLGATLLSQQVLLLALYFMGKIPHTSALYPPATSQSALKSTSAPFKLLLAALVVANKHLDDNSFRNSTFAQVANVTLPEVNALEYSMLAGLEFDVNVAASDWLAWLQSLQYSRVTPFNTEPSRVEEIVGHIILDAHQQNQEHEKRFGERANAVLESSFSRSEASSPSLQQRQLDNASAIEVPVVPLSPAPSDISSLVSGGTFDMDASGPLERDQRPRYAKAFNAAITQPASFDQYGLGVFAAEGTSRPITVA